MQKIKRKETIIIIILSVALVLAGIKIISMEKHINEIENEISKSREEVKAEIKQEVNGEIIQMTFIAGMDCFAKEILYAEGVLLEEDYYYLLELEQIILEEPTYEKVEEYLNGIEEITEKLPGFEEVLKTLEEL